MLLITEDKGESHAPTHNPNYHSAQDTLDTLNLGFHHKVTQALVAALAEIGDT